MLDKKLKIFQKGNKCAISTSAYIGFEEHGKGSIVLGDRVRVRPHVVLRSCGGVLKTGSRVVFGAYTVVHAHGNVIIGSDVLISPNVGIYAQNHGIKLGQKIANQTQKKGKVVIGNDVWIGANAVIVGPCVIGDGAVIGANSVVRFNVPKNAIVANVSTKVVGYRK